MRVIPAVDVKDGECVQLVQGKEGTGKQYGDPVEAATAWTEQGADLLHLIDLDGALEGRRRNAPVIQRIARETDAEIQVGGGVRSVDDAKELFSLGARRVIMGTAAVEDPEIVSEASDYGDIMVSLDASGGEVVVEGWKQGSGLSLRELAPRFEEVGAESILYTDVDQEGLMDGVDPEPVRSLVEEVSIPVVASGGVTTTDDVGALRRAGAWGVVIGTAFYEGRLTYKQAVEAAN